MPGEALEPVLAPLDAGRVAGGDADHADSGDEGRDQVRRDLLPVGAGRHLVQLDEHDLVLREGQPHDELDLARQVVQAVGDDDDDVAVCHQLLGARGVLHRAGRVSLGEHREAALHGLGVLFRGARLAGGEFGTGTVLLAVAAASPEDPELVLRPDALDVGRDRERLQDAALVVGVERAVRHHAASTEVHDGDGDTRRNLAGQVGLPVAAIGTQDPHRSPRFQRTEPSVQAAGLLVDSITFMLKSQV